MPAPPDTHRVSPLAALLRCLHCAGALECERVGEAPAPALGPEGLLRCPRCAATYPITGGTARMVADLPPADAEVKARTADSFAYEWQRFGGTRPEWQENFRGYMQPLVPSDLAGMLVLDVGTGSGRHSREAARHGARVVAVDLGAAIDVARGNLPPDVLTVQADAERLPFDDGTFDMVMSIGVLHHLPDTERALRGLVRYARPGGRVQVYLYWQPERGWHRRLLRGVTAARRVTTRMPHRLLEALCYPLSAVLFATFVLPHKVLRAVPRARAVADALPLKTYADYPFTVCVNDQLDRLSAPIERRFTREEVHAMLTRAGLRDVEVVAHHGWVAGGIRPGPS